MTTKNTLNATKIAKELHAATVDKAQIDGGALVKWAKILDAAGISGHAGGKLRAAESVEAVIKAYGVLDAARASDVRTVAFYDAKTVEDAFKHIRDKKAEIVGTSTRVNNITTTMTALRAAKNDKTFDAVAAAKVVLAEKAAKARLSEQKAAARKEAEPHEVCSVDIQAIGDKLADHKLANVAKATELVRLDPAVKAARNAALDAVEAFAQAMLKHGKRASVEEAGEAVADTTMKRLLALKAAKAAKANGSRRRRNGAS